MSTYKFLISKNNIAAAADEHIDYNDADGDQDVDVTLTVNGTEIHAATCVDAGCVLQYTGTLAQGYHTVKIQPEAGKPTDVRVDKVLIDDHTMVGSQYLMDTRIFGSSWDFLRFQSCVPFRSPKGNDYVWWGDVYNADFTQTSHTTHYRPHIVTDLGQWWEWSFSVTASGHIHWECCDTDNILYDSTENHNYYAAKSVLYNDSAIFPEVDPTAIPQLDDSTYDDSTARDFSGIGTYNADFIYDSDEMLESRTHMYLTDQVEWESSAWYYLHFWPRHNIDPIVIT